MIATAVLAPWLLLAPQTADPDAFGAAFERGLVAFARGDFVSARGSFEEALAIKPDHAQARFNLARALRETGEPERALEHLRAIESRMQDRFAFLLTLARTHLDLGWTRETRATLEEALELHPKAARVHYLAGELLLTERNLVEARKKMEDASELQPDWVQPYVRMGEISLALGDPKSAIDPLEKAVALAPGASAILVSLGNAYAGAGRTTDAAGSWEKALELSPEMPRVRAQLARALYSTGQVEKGFSQYRLALEQDADDVATRSALALALFATQRHEEAGVEFLEISKREPANGVALYYLGVIAADRRENELARERLERSLDVLEGREGEMAILSGRAGESYPIRIAAAVELSEVLLESEEPEAAVRLLESVLEKAPDHATAHYQLGLAYRRLGRREEAARELSLFKQINDAREHDQLGLKALESGDEAVAIAEFEKAVALYPADRVARGELARLLLKRGDGPAAARHLEHVVEYADSPESAFRDLIAYYCEVGELGRARALHERALARGIEIESDCLSKP